MQPRTRTIVALTISVVLLWPMWNLVGLVGLFGTNTWGWLTVYSLRFGLVLGPLVYGYELVNPPRSMGLSSSEAPLSEQDMTDTVAAAVRNGVDPTQAIVAVRAHFHPEVATAKRDERIRLFVPAAKTIWKISFAVGLLAGVLAIAGLLFLAWVFGGGY